MQYSFILLGCLLSITVLYAYPLRGFDDKKNEMAQEKFCYQEMRFNNGCSCDSRIGSESDEIPSDSEE